MITEGNNAPTLSVAIVLHNSNPERLGGTLRCLSSALQLALDEGSLTRARVVLRDNASEPDYVEQLRQLHSDQAQKFPATLELSLSTQNVGYGAGVNAAFAGCEDDWLLVLNPDIELAGNALHEVFRSILARDDAVAFGPLCHGGDGEREYLCKRYPSVLGLLVRGFGGRLMAQRFAASLAHYEYRDLSDQEAATVELLSGACLLVRGNAYAAVDGFDERFFMYFEDFDLSRRLAARGECVYFPAMRVVHHGGNASRKGWRHIRWFVTSAIRFFGRHGWRWY